jgi:hypothetical protein
MTAIAAPTVVADVRLRVTAVAVADGRVSVVADVPLPVAVVVAIRRLAADRTVVDRHTVVAVAADMEGNTTLDSFPA